jgi:hypothetical protein
MYMLGGHEIPRPITAQQNHRLIHHPFGGGEPALTAKRSVIDLVCAQSQEELHRNQELDRSPTIELKTNNPCRLHGIHSSAWGIDRQSLVDRYRQIDGRGDNLANASVSLSGENGLVRNARQPISIARSSQILVGDFIRAKSQVIQSERA